MRRSRWAVVAGGVLVGATLLAACSAQHASTRSAGLEHGPDVAAAAPAAGGGALAASAGSSTAGGSMADGAAGTADDTDVTLTSPAIIRTAQLQVRVKSASIVAAAANRAEQIALDTGGRVDTDNRTSGPDATAELTLRVPTGAVTTVLGRLAALGTEQSRELGSRDVTTTLVDVTSRVASARAAIAQLDRIYARATDVSDVVKIETTLSEREADLESLQARQRDLRAQAALATITLDLTTVATAPAKHHSSTAGFLGGLRRGWDNFARAASWLAGAAGAVLPFAVLLVVVGGAGLLIRRRTRTAPSAAPPAGDPV